MALIFCDCRWSSANIFDNEIARKSFLLVVPTMQNNEERWKELCKQAATKEDHAKVSEQFAEINRLLEEKEDRLKALRSDKPTG